MRPGQHITHGPRGRWLRPWQIICQCGLAAWPCPSFFVGARRLRKPPGNERPSWDAPTEVLPNETFRLTPGQMKRSQGEQAVTLLAVRIDLLRPDAVILLFGGLARVVGTDRCSDFPNARVLRICPAAGGAEVAALVPADFYPLVVPR